MILRQAEFALGCSVHRRQRFEARTSMKMTPDSVDCVTISSTITSVPAGLFVDAERLDVNPFCTEFSSTLWEKYGFSRPVCGLVVSGLVFLDVTSRFCTLCRKVAWNERSC